MDSLSKNKANYSQLTPLSFLYRTAKIFPDQIAWIYGKRKANYLELLKKSKNLALAVKSLNVKKGNVVSVMLPNVPEMIEAHFGIPMSGAILNSLNTRLEKKTIEFILRHSKSKVLIFHEDYIDLIRSLSKKINLKYVIVSDVKKIKEKGIIDYCKFLEQSSSEIKEKKLNYYPSNEWDSIFLSPMDLNSLVVSDSSFLYLS